MVLLFLLDPSLVFYRNLGSLFSETCVLSSCGSQLLEERGSLLVFPIVPTWSTSWAWALTMFLLGQLLP